MRITLATMRGSAILNVRPRLKTGKSPSPAADIFLQTMKTLLIAIVLLVSTLGQSPGETFVPRFNVDHKAFIDEALSYLLKTRPAIKAKNLEFVGIDYHYQPMPDATVECGPDGCVVSPAAPFQETLSISFKVISSKKEVDRDGERYTEFDTLAVQFPTPRMNEWFINDGTMSSLSPKKVEKE